MSETETNAGEPAPPLAPGVARRGLSVGAVVVIAAIFVAFPLLVTDPTTTSIAFFALVFMVAASAWNIFSGYSGYLALGHAVFFGTGGYAVAVAARDWHVAGGWPVFVLVLFGGLVAGLIAIPAGIAVHNYVLPVMGHAAQTNVPPSVLNVYQPAELVLLALSGLVIAVAGALGPAGWAAKTRTAFALRAE